MDPVFTLQWPEFVVANQLQKLLPKSEGYSVLIPASRQEKGIDLAIIRKRPKAASRVVTIQIKASRTYSLPPPVRETTKRFQHYTWFNRFEVPETADFILLFGMYPRDASQTRRIESSWYNNCILLFTNKKMSDFIESCKTVQGNPDRMFGFGFNDGRKIVQTRGDQNREFRDYTDHLLEKSVEKIRGKLNNQ